MPNPPHRMPIGLQDEPRLRLYLSDALGEEVGALTIAPRLVAGGIKKRNYYFSAVVGGEERRFVLRCQPEVIPAWRRTDGLYDAEAGSSGYNSRADERRSLCGRWGIAAVFTPNSRPHKA